MRWLLFIGKLFTKKFRNVREILHFVSDFFSILNFFKVRLAPKLYSNQYNKKGLVAEIKFRALPKAKDCESQSY